MNLVVLSSQFLEVLQYFWIEIIVFIKFDCCFWTMSRNLSYQLYVKVSNFLMGRISCHCMYL